MKIIMQLLCLLALTQVAILAQGDANKGKALYATCAACHGQNGEGMQALNSPALAGQEDWYLLTQLKNFKAGIRGKHPKDIYGMQMAPMAMTLADEQAMKDVIAYIKTFKPAALTDTITGGNAAKGKTLYATCAACHGQQAEGMKALNAPKLTIQQDWYLVRQLHNFKDGIRGSDPKDIYGMQMKPMAMTLPDEQAIKDVVAYIRQLAKK